DEVGFVARGKKVRFFVAAEVALDKMIARYYTEKAAQIQQIADSPVPAPAEPENPANWSAAIPTPADSEHREKVLLVADDTECGPLLKSLLEYDNYEITTTDSADDAIEIIGDQLFHTVLIKDTVSGDYLDLIDRLRKSSPRTRVHYYESISALLLGNQQALQSEELLLHSLRLFSSMFTKDAARSSSHAGRVGHYVNRLCRRIGLPEKERMMIATAAHLHDLACYYYQTKEEVDYRRAIDLSARLLHSLDFPPVVVGTLQSAYVDLKGRFTKRLPIEALGGNIITVVDLFCETISDDKRLSLDKLDALKKKLDDLTGKLFLPEVTESFVEMIEEDVFNAPEPDSHFQVLVFSEDQEVAGRFEANIAEAGFQALSETSQDALITLFNRSRPDMIVLALPGDAESVMATINELGAGGIAFYDLPTMLLVDDTAIATLTPLLDAGIDDILTHDGSRDLLMAKLGRIRQQLADKANRSGEIPAEPDQTEVSAGDTPSQQPA
ncbi:MAG: hypothetical protein KAT79_06505, partial [candidate division Zixibacteria bacterium]|nr:hypothetical protein [candidate division Zixibacteria bacterium]